MITALALVFLLAAWQGAVRFRTIRRSRDRLNRISRAYEEVKNSPDFDSPG
jgi:hypothetical protein